MPVVYLSRRCLLVASYGSFGLLRFVQNVCWAVCGGDIAVAALPIARSWVWGCGATDGGNGLAEKLFELAIDSPGRNLYSTIWVDDASVRYLTLAVMFGFRC